MSIYFILSLLAAFHTTTVSAGPVPHHHRRLYIPPQNTSALSGVPSISVQTATRSPMLSASSLPLAESLIVTPIQQSVFTTIQNAITFFDPSGKPMATMPAETLVSTIFFTPSPVVTPSQGKPTSGPLSASQTLSPIPSTLLTAGSSQSNPGAPVSAVSTTLLETKSRQFTYSPLTNSVASASTSLEPQRPSTPVVSSSEPASSQNASFSTSLGGFERPGASTVGTLSIQPSSSIVTKSSSLLAVSTKSATSANPSTFQSTAAIAPSSLSVKSSSSDPITTTLSFVFVTETEYTTVTPTPSQVPSSQNAVPQPSSNGKPSSPQSQPTPSAAPSSRALELSAPPVVIITLYTTVTPTPQSVTSKTIISTSAAPTLQSTSNAASSTSILAPPPAPSTSIIPQPITPSTSATPIPASSSQVSPPPPASLVSSQSPVPPPAPTPTAPPPLIVTPIPVVTIIQTVTEKETVTATVTVRP